MRTVEVKLSAPYSVLIGDGILDGVGKSVKEICRAHKVLVVTDGNVAKLYLERVKSSLSGAGFDVHEYVFEAGEKSKNTQTYLEIIDCLGSRGFKRTDAVVALGGGVVGDIAGFAAATYMRGIDVVQVPTSLLAMIDSSVGGKTGVDLSYGKNLLGAFYQPKLVIADTSLLETLPRSEWKNGIGEGVKYACLVGGRIMQILSDGLETSVIDEFVALCVDYKAQIVVNDEKEKGQRKLLNFGHTVGHAVEKLSDFKIAHGIAVAYGIKVMVTAAYKHGELGETDFKQICLLLEKYMLDCVESFEDIADAVVNDKKAEGENEISYAAICAVGNCVVRKSSIKEFIDYIAQ